MKYRDSVTRLRGAKVADPYGGTRLDWADPARSNPIPADVQPVSSSEDVAVQQRVETRYRVEMSLDADITAADRLKWRSRTLEVIGDVEEWDQGARSLNHKALIARRVTDGSG